MASKEESADKEKNLVSGNGPDGKVLKINDILNMSDNPIVIKLRKLEKYDITREMIEERYENITTNMETIEKAIEALSTVYEDLVRYINKLPNGIVIDPRTGEKNEAASLRQAEKIGILDTDHYNRFSKEGKEIFNSAIINQIKGNEDKILSEESKFFLSKFEKDLNSITRSSINNDFDLSALYESNKSNEDTSKSDINNNINKSTFLEAEGENFKKQFITYYIAKSHIDDTNMQFNSNEIIVLCSGYISSAYNVRRDSLEALKKINPELGEASADDIVKNAIKHIDNYEAMLENFGVKSIDELDSMGLYNLVEQINNSIEKYIKQYLDTHPKENETLDNLEANKDKVLYMEAALEASKGTKKYDSLKRDIAKCYRENPGLKYIHDIIRDKNGEITPENKEIFNQRVADEKEKIATEVIIKEINLESLKGSDEYERGKKALNFFYRNNPALRYLEKTLRNDDGTLSEEGKKILDAQKEKMESYLILLETRIEQSKGTPEYGSLLVKRNTLCEKSFLLSLSTKMRDEKGNLTEFGKKEIEKTKNNLVNNEIKKVIEFFKKENLNNIDENTRNIYLSYLAAGISENSPKELKDACIDELKRYYSADKILDSNDELIDALSSFNSDEIRNNISQVVLAKEEAKQKVAEEYKFSSTLEEIETQRISDTDIDNAFKKKSEDIDVSLIDINKTDMQRSFDNSKISFTAEDEKKLNESYMEATLGSWIDNKENVIKLQYAYLMTKKEELEKTGKDATGKAAINAINIKIERFKNKYPDISQKYTDENGNLLPEIKEESERYNKSKVASKLLRYYSKGSVINVERNEYDKMQLAEKRQYIRYTMLGLIYGAENESLMKLAQRRLEALNTEENEFISFDKDGKPILNKERILKEYNDVDKTRKEWETFESLSEYIYTHERDYYIKHKLDEYEKLDSEDFKMVDMSDKVKALNFIENIKLTFNRNKNQQKYKNNDSIGEKNVDDIKDKNSVNSQEEKDSVDNKHEEIIRDNESDENGKNSDLEDRNDISQDLIPDNNTIFSRIRRAFNDLNSKITSYLNKDNNIFSKIKKVFNKDDDKKDEIISQNIRSENMPGESQQNNSQENSWKVEGVTGKIDESKIEKSQENGRKVESGERDEIRG